MMLVRDRNEGCLNLNDKPRMPVEPASRHASPEDDEDQEQIRDVFCICRQPEAGMMIECELCHEWYVRVRIVDYFDCTDVVTGITASA